MAVNSDKEMCWLPVHPTLITSPGLEAKRGCVTLKPNSRAGLMLQESDYNPYSLTEVDFTKRHKELYGWDISNLNIVSEE